MVIMKTIVSNIMLALFAVFATASCNNSDVSDMQLGGNCEVTAFALDNYEGTIDATNRTITVRIPETYATDSMKVTALSLSEGAQSDIKSGDKLNMYAPHTIHVTNVDVYSDWTISIKHDEAKIKSFKINDTYTGIIDENNKAIAVYVPEGLDLSNLTPTVEISDNATITPTTGVPMDFSRPVTFKVENNTASAEYTVTVTPIGKPSAVYVGLASTMDQLNIEEQTACKWMLENVPNSIYASFTDIKNGTVDLSECKVIWWHYHKDGGIDGKSAFENAAPEALAAALRLKDYYDNGGSFLFTRFATNMPAEIGAVKNDACPNNCWGQAENSAETVSSPWSFSIQGHTAHPLFQNLIMNSSEPNNVYTCDAGYRITNSTAQWHIGTDWGGYADYATWRNETGAQDLAYGGDGAIVVWEFPSTANKGTILCIGSGCYDWYSIADVTENYHKNVAKMTLNAFNYLKNK
ncbi:hypothetical protein HMPREF0663_10164 [Hoylesella oralis ATCC 33269]|uniref:Uncharacterized protein n=1 Tax=Hoylesella oralis ATCC 33269 TaxID=873533 RepID=E7RM14_9BACT|nr:DUF4960 domain-containing protein [Hoylesella oralis]EFZ37795.1 hypothetical protein HMPREF0663_10164 [Hoylesella oralis ATCC 33269]EPH16968.1 hypothetical protein HMPREF1475_01293 [Hoylesella oralis HGA0225]SHF45922.1 protein of unknown function [Hoylesella oralis]